MDQQHPLGTPHKLVHKELLQVVFLCSRLTYSIHETLVELWENLFIYYDFNFHRFAHRPVDDGVIAEITSKLEKEQAKNARLEQFAARQISQTDTSKETTNITEDKNELEKPKETNTKPEVQSDHNGSKNKQTNIDKTSDSLEQASTQSESRNVQNESSANNLEPMETTSYDHVTSSDNMSMDVDKTDDTVSEQIVTSGSRKLEQHGSGQMSQAEASRRGAEALRNMNIPGVEVITPDDFYDLTPREQQVLLDIRLKCSYVVLILSAL